MHEPTRWWHGVIALAVLAALMLIGGAGEAGTGEEDSVRAEKFWQRRWVSFCGVVHACGRQCFASSLGDTLTHPKDHICEEFYPGWLPPHVVETNAVAHLDSILEREGWRRDGDSWVRLTGVVLERIARPTAERLASHVRTVPTTIHFDWEPVFEQWKQSREGRRAP